MEVYDIGRLAELYDDVPANLEDRVRIERSGVQQPEIHIAVGARATLGH